MIDWGDIIAQSGGRDKSEDGVMTRLQLAF